MLVSLTKNNFTIWSFIIVVYKKSYCIRLPEAIKNVIPQRQAKKIMGRSRTTIHINYKSNTYAKKGPVRV